MHAGGFDAGKTFHKAVGQRLHGGDVHVGVDHRFALAFGAVDKLLLTLLGRKFFQGGEFGLRRLGVNG